MLLLAMPLAVALFFAFALYRAGPGRRRRLFMELALLLVAFFVYFGVRAVTEGSPERALANGERIIAIQQSLGIYVEPQLNAVAAQRPWLTTIMNWVYIWGHWPLIAAVAVWLYRAAPRGYRLVRNAFMISGLLGFLFFALLPTAPPRLMEGTTFVDTVTEYSNSYRMLQPPTVTNQYAAFPSLHFGWNLLIGIALASYARRWAVRTAGAVSPFAMLTATLFTANHYLLDIAMGAAVALTGLAIATQLGRWTRGRAPLPGAVPPLPVDRPAAPEIARFSVDEADPDGSFVPGIRALDRRQASELTRT